MDNPYKILDNNPNKDHILSILLSLTTSAGVYQYFDKTGKVIYVGKAKNLKARVLSYFRNQSQHNLKTQILVRKIYDIKFVYVLNETEALLMENNLIKKFKPRYNILLKDDKTYPWIRITSEEYPRIFTTRHIVHDGSLYYGPYPNGRMLKELMQLIRQLFCYRTCNYNLTQQSIEQNKFKNCLNAQIGLCLSPCTNEQTKEEYQKDINSIKEIIKGHFSQQLTKMKAQMMHYADILAFEKAQLVKTQITLLENYCAKSEIISVYSHDMEVYGYVEDEDILYLNCTKIVEGKINMSFCLEIEKKLDLSTKEILSCAISQNRLTMNWLSKEIIINEKIDLPENYCLQTIPSCGEKKKLLDFSLRNAMLYRADKIKKQKVLDPERWSNKIVIQMQKDLHLDRIPHHIECFDNSNIQGNQPVASCVVFREGKPSVKEYRHFNIKTVVGPDDFASMREIVFRRYSRLKQEGKQLPDLIVIDGGKGQLSCAVEALKEAEVFDNVIVIGLAKKLEEIYFPSDPYPICLDKKSHTLQVIQHIRDEAHRFGITFHRNKRSKAMIHSQLLDIEGIGEKTAKDLLLKFVSVSKIKLAPFEQIRDCIGKSKAEKVYKYFHPEE